MAAPGGTAAGLMLCDREAPPDNWLPPAAEEGCELVSPRWRVRGGVRPQAAGAHVPPALRLSLIADLADC